MQLEEVGLDELSGFRVKLRGMEISNTAAFTVDAKDVRSVRSTISQLHGETNLRFTTKKQKNGEGIYVWRLADAETK